MKFFFGFVFLLVCQRIFELILARRHESVLRRSGATESDKSGYRIIVLMHSAFFAALVIEKVALNRVPGPAWPVFLAFFGAAQFLRYWAIHSLGVYWNTRILVLPGHPIVAKGPYRYFRHPNYLAVAVEFAVIPLMFSCYYTAAVFTMLNALALLRRVKIESKALTEARG